MRALVEMLEGAPAQVPAQLTPTLLRQQPDLWPPIRARIIQFVTMMNAVTPRHGLPTDYTWKESSNALYRGHSAASTRRHSAEPATTGRPKRRQCRASPTPSTSVGRRHPHHGPARLHLCLRLNCGQIRSPKEGARHP